MTQLKSKVATKVYHEGAGIRVKYHDTDVVTTSPEHIRLQTGGWFTQTTKRRMNEASEAFGLGFYVYQAKKQWYASFRGEVFAFEAGTLKLDRTRAGV